MSNLLQQTQEICRLMEIRPAHSKGQNFLINEQVYQEIINIADLNSHDTVLEVGPGLGFLTVELARRVQRVVAVELDSKLVNYLKIGLDSQDVNKVEVWNEDILHFDLQVHKLIDRKYKVVANLPYNITSHFLRRFLSGVPRPQSLVLMLQQEVAERIVASAPHMSILAVSVQYYAKAEIIKKIPASNFWPKPKVASALIKFETKNRAYSLVEDKQFFRIVKIGFSARRKMLKNNLMAGLKIEVKIIEQILIEQGLDSKVRAEGLSLTQWQELFAAIKEFMV